MGNDIVLLGERFYLRPFVLDDALLLWNLRVKNRVFLKPWEPRWPDSHFTLSTQTAAIQQNIADWNADRGYTFGIFLRANDALIGRISLGNVVRGAWQSCTLGYFIDADHTRKGYMSAAIALIGAFAFEIVKLHRVQAAVMPRNLPSIRVLEKTGFRFEGQAEYYLNINGVWEHHYIYSKTVEMMLSGEPIDF